MTRASARAAAAAEELDDPEGEQEGSVLLVGPGIRGIFVFIGGVCSRSDREGAELSLRSKSEDGGGNDDTDVGAAEQAGAQGGNDTSDGFFGADAGADHVQSDQHDDGGVGDEGD